jgi:hypothetical protein
MLLPSVQVLNRLLWGLNGLLGMGIGAFAWFFLLFPKEASSLKNVQWDDNAVVLPAAPSAGDDSILKALKNPLKGDEPRSVASAPNPFRAILKGTIPSVKDPKSGAAFIRSSARNTELVVFLGEEIQEGGKAYDEFRGWKLIEVGKYRATFTNGAQIATLTFQESSAPPPAPPLSREGQDTPPAGWIGQAYQSTSFKSRILGNSENRQVWGLDPDEIDWALQNKDSIMGEAFQVSPSASGGIRIDSVRAGSIGAARGVMDGDIVREVNGQPLRGVAELKSLMTDLSMRAQSGLRLTIERAGKPMAIEYRALSK